MATGSKAFVLKNTTDKENDIVLVFVELSFVKYQLCEPPLAQRLVELYLEKKI